MLANYILSRNTTLMKKMIRIACIMCISAIFVTSCKKDDKSRMELITSGNWKIVSDQVKVGNGGWDEGIQAYSSCELDNYLKFSSNNTVEYNEGATMCDPLDDQSITAPWAFENGETSLNIFGEVLIIEELTGSTLTVTSSDTYNGTTTYYKQVFKH